MLARMQACRPPTRIHKSHHPHKPSPLNPPPPQPALIDMVAAGTLMVFAVAALALIWHP